MNDINNIFGVPDKEISCPSCGKIHGHTDTKVDINSCECSICVAEMGYCDVELVDGIYFIEKILGYNRIY